MSRVRAAVVVPGTAEQTRALWFDLTRWPAFVDGFAAVARVDPEWPVRGELMRTSTRHGRGRVIERADGTFEDTRTAGTQAVRFEPVADGTRVVAELDYRIKQRTPVTPLVDLLFVRRAVRDALTRTVQRFAAEARMDADLRAEEQQPHPTERRSRHAS